MSTTERKITVVSTKNNKVKFYNTDVATWGELNSLISSDFDMSNLKATENINKATLEHIDAVLPTGEFRLFLRPVKTKSGNQDFDSMKFGELRATFKDDDNVKKFLSDIASKTGRNWTQLKTDELREGLKQYHSSSTKPATETVQEVQEVEENVAEEVVEVMETVTPLTTTQKFEAAIDLLEQVMYDVLDSEIDEDLAVEIEYNIQEFIDYHKDDILETLVEEFGASSDKSMTKKATKSSSKMQEESPEDKAKREAKEAEEKETADALREAQEFQDGII